MVAGLSSHHLYQHSPFRIQFFPASTFPFQTHLRVCTKEFRRKFVLEVP